MVRPDLSRGLDKKDAWQALTKIIMKKLEYPLLALTLTEDECNFIMPPILKSGSPKVGIYRNMPRAVVYGDTSHQGMGLHNPYTKMGI